VTLVEDLSSLGAAMAQARRDELPEILGALACLQALVLARLTVGPVPPAQHAQDRLLSLPEVAGILGVPDDRAYDLARQRRFPVVVIGKYRRVRESALRAYISANEDGVRPSARTRRSA
jgi:excisionase family DNA binding protein